MLVVKSGLQHAEPKGMAGVTVWYRPCTTAEFGELCSVPFPPFTPDAQAEVVRLFGRHVDRITGLGKPGEPPPGARPAKMPDGSDGFEIDSFPLLFEHGELWMVEAVIDVVIRGARLTARDLGNSAPPSSGAGKGGTSTAPLVDPL